MDFKKPYLDENSLLEISTLEALGEGSLLVELINTFEATTPEILSRILKAFESSDVAALQKHVHSLKSSSASLGLLRLYEMTSYIETNAGLVIEEKQEELIRDLKSAYFETLSALENFIDTHQIRRVA